MKTVGVYVFTDMIKKRETKKRETYFDGQNYIGIRYIVSQIDKSRYSIGYVSKDNINSVDYVLVSLTSYYDALNIVNELYGKTITSKVIVGGAGCSNVSLLSAVADIVIVGRGEDIINHILDDDERIDGVWYKDADPDVRGPVMVLPARHMIDIEDNTIGYYHEEQVGCNRRCYFCEYGWKHRYVTSTSGYGSGLLSRETMFRDIDFSAYSNHDLVSAIDGMTEATRHIVNKSMTNQEITEKLMEIYSCDKRDYFSLKLYCLVGYPWEQRFEPGEFISAVDAAKKASDKRLNILVVSPHFMPMPFTPMENEAVNWHNFRDDIKRYDSHAMGTGNIKVFWNWSLASSPISSAEATIINRASVSDVDAIKKVMCSSKYKNLDSIRKRMVIEKFFSHLVGHVDSVLPYIQRENDTTKAKQVYLDRKSRIDR